MKKIGLRTIKTAICVFCCLLVFVILKLFEYIPGVPDNFAFSWYNPFFAGLATAYSVHASKEASLNQAKNRCVASVIGGGIGILLITVYELCGGKWPNLQSVSLETFNFIIPYLLISIFTIAVVVTGVSLKQHQAVFVSILTFLSVTVNPNINVGYWQWQFGINRILSTIIGVLIALGVNLFRLPHKYKNKNLLFCVGIDGMLLKDSDRFRGFMQYKMNYLNRIGANVTLFTTRTPTTFMPLLEDVKITHPVVCMSGAALYDAVHQHYIAAEMIDVKTAEEVYQVLKKNNVSPFVNQIHEDVLFTYNESLDNEGERIYADDKKNAAYCSYVPGPAPKDEIIYFLIVEKEDVVIKLIDDIKSNKGLSSKLSILVYDVFETNQAPNLKYVKIYSKRIEELAILKKYCAEEGLDIVGFTSSNHANHLLKHSRIGVSLDSLDEEYRKYCTKLVPKENPENLFKEVQRIYHYNLAKYGKKD